MHGRRRWVVLLVGLFAGMGAIVVGQALSDLRSRIELADFQRASCVRGLFDRTDGIQADRDAAAARRDEADFRRMAAAARQADGNLATASGYRQSADRADVRALRADARADRRSRRLLGADPKVLGTVDRAGRPSARAVALAEATCLRQVPHPSLFSL